MSTPRLRPSMPGVFLRPAARALAAAALLALAGPAGGCFSRQSLMKESFAFAAPPLSGAPAPAGLVVGIRILEVAAHFEGRPLVYRTGEHSYEQDPYAEFLVPPRRGLAIPIRAHLRNSGAVADVVDPESAVRPDLRAEVYVEELYGDFRDPRAPAAVIGMRFVFLDAAPESEGKVVLQKDCARRIPVEGRSAAAVVAGWDRGLAEILDEVAGELEGLEG